MIPTNSSATTNGCDNISSNCVIWQGPDISCIDLCNGDTISEVVFKLATEVCSLITNGVSANPSLTGLDLTCLNIRGVTPTELVPVLQAMIVQICNNSTTTGTPVPTAADLLTLPTCLQYTDSNGNPVTQVYLEQYAILTAQKVCSNLERIIAIEGSIVTINTRLNTIEACVFPGGVCAVGTSSEVQIIPTCVSNVGQLTNVSVVVSALEIAFCALQTAVGTPSLINNAISQSVITGSYATLTSSNVTYSGIAGWNNTPTTLAQSVQNAWVVIDDLYTSISSIQSTCCPTGCDSVIFNYLSSGVVNSSGIIDGILFDFTNSVIPSGYLDTTNHSIITLTDADGSSVTTTFSVANLQNSGSGLTVSTGTLNTFQNISITVDFSVTDTIDTCESIQSSVVNGLITCPTMLLTGITTTGVTVNFTNVLGITAVYTIDILDGSTVVDTFVINSPGASPSHSFTGLSPNTNYIARLTVAIGGVTKVCTNTVAFQTVSNALPCTNGMDVVFVLDYTQSMSGEITTIQNDIPGLVAGIVTSSGSNDYRLALVTADESNVVTPDYGSCIDYTDLPLNQRLSLLGTNNNYIYTTFWEIFQNNNSSSFTTALNLLNGGVDTTCINIGDGNGVAEPTDYAAQLAVAGGSVPGAFRANAAKYVVIITDQLPGGISDSFNAATWAGIQNMIAYANTNGIKYVICGVGSTLGATINGVYIQPWIELAQQTGGATTTSYLPTTISSVITGTC